MLTMAMQDWFDAMAAKDIDAVMATMHEDLLVVLNEQLLTREEMKEGFQHSMAGEDWIMSDFNVKFEDEHSLTFDFKGIENGVQHQYRNAAVYKDGLIFRMISYFEPVWGRNCEQVMIDRAIRQLALLNETGAVVNVLEWGLALWMLDRQI